MRLFDGPVVDMFGRPCVAEQLARHHPMYHAHMRLDMVEYWWRAGEELRERAKQFVADSAPHAVLADMAQQLTRCVALALA